MSDLELRAHAMRLAEEDLADWQGPTGDCTAMRAGIALARAYLAEYPADDDEAIDEAWLVRSGLGRAVFLSNGFMCRFYDDGPCIAHVAPGNDFECELPAKTRGQVRRLCRALGIELQETT